MKAFIFDLDGVLVHTDQFHYLAWKKIADELGIYFDQAINNQLRGVSRKESLEIILESYAGTPFSVEEKMALAERKNEFYKTFLDTLGPSDVEDSVRDTLKKLKSAGYKLAIGSSSENAKFILDKAQLMDDFEAISDGTNIVHGKPNPEVFIKAAKFLMVNPEECFVVEDAVAGIEAAKAGKMQAIGIGEAATFEKTDIALTTFSDLTHLI